MAFLLLDDRKKMSVAQRVNAYLDSLGGWTLSLKFNEASGNIVNYGSDGGTGTVTGCTQAQAGQLGASEAYSFDGVDDIVTFANAAVPATKALTTQRWCFLVNASAMGENNQGMFWCWGNNFNSFGLGLVVSGGNALRSGIITDGTSAAVGSSAGTVDFLNSWALVFMDYDDTDVLGLGRHIRLFKATATTPTTLLTLASDAAATGTVTAQTGDLIIGNRSATDVTFAGLIDFVRCGAGLWSPAGAPTDLTIPNRIRSLVFGV